MTYKLKNLEFNTHGWPVGAMLIHDGRRRPVNKTELQAQVASDDYFALLATQLDQLSQSLQNNAQSDYILLENTIDDLLYLHQHYQITKK